MEEENFRTDTQNARIKTSNSIWASIHEHENTATALYQLSCEINLVIMKLVLKNVLPKSFFTTQSFDLRLTKHLRGFKSEDAKYTVYPQFLSDQTKFLLGKFCSEDKETKRKILSIKN